MELTTCPSEFASTAARVHKRTSTFGFQQGNVTRIRSVFFSSLFLPAVFPLLLSRIDGGCVTSTPSFARSANDYVNVMHSSIYYGFNGRCGEFHELPHGRDVFRTLGIENEFLRIKSFKFIYCNFFSSTLIRFLW